MGRIEATEPSPPGDYDVVVVGSGPGGLQTSYFLHRLNVGHALISADDAPGGMFRRWPIFQRLLSRTRPDAPHPRATREYEWFDHNSLLAVEPESRALVADTVDRRHATPSRAEMQAGIEAFARRAQVTARYGCRWESTEREPDGRIALSTTDGIYRCRAVVFATGVTEPWRPPVPGIEGVPHYADTRPARQYQGRRVFIVGKRNSAWEIAHALMPWAAQVVVASPQPVDSRVLALSSVRARYFEPLEERANGGATAALDATIERIERTANGFRVHARTTADDAECVVDADDAIAATGFGTPLGDLESIGVRTVAGGRIPALTPWFESTSAPGVFFAGNASQGARGLRKHGVPSQSSSVVGFRYNARLLAEHLAARLSGRPVPPRRVAAGDLPRLLAAELARSPELWAQKGYLARAAALDRDGGAQLGGVVPLQHAVDDSGHEAVAVAVEMDASGAIRPAVYRTGRDGLRELTLDPEPLHRFDTAPYERAIAEAVQSRA